MKSHLIIIKIILAISIIISVGTALGIVSYLVNLKKSLSVAEQPVVEPITEPISDVESNWKTYQNEGYGFEFEYPLSYTLKEVSVDYISLRKMENEKVKYSFNVTIEDNRSGTNDSKLTFEEFATELALENCTVDDPDKSIYCTEVTEIKPFVNENKISGYEIYLNEVTEDYFSNKISNRTRGPIFVMGVIEQTYTRARGIFFDFGDEEEILEQEKQELIDRVVSTFKFTEEDDATNWQTYQNGRHGFEFNYPLNYTLEKGTNNYALLYRTEHKKTDWSFNVTIEDNRSGTNDSKLTFEEFATELALENCAVDDPDKSIYCTEVTEIKPFVNENKISGYEIYLNEVTENLLNDKISNRIRGPVFAMDVSKQTNNLSRGVFFDFGDEEKILEQEKQRLIDLVVFTFKFTEEREEDTANWRAYQNEKYGYEFRYPHEWNTTSNDADSISFNTKTEGKSIYGGGIYGGIEYCGTLEQGQTLKNFVEENYSGAGLGSDSEIEESINGYNVIVSITPSAHIYIMRETKSVYFENNHEVVSLFFAYNVNFGKYPEHKHALDLFNQVVSTFKFTEK